MTILHINQSSTIKQANTDNELAPATEVAQPIVENE